MKPKKITIADGVNLNAMETDKFKTNYLSFNFILPLDKERSAYNTLASHILLRGTKLHPDTVSIEKAMDDLYSASVSVKSFKRGRNHVVSLSAYWLNDRFSIDGTNITSGTLAMVKEFLFEPYLENGIFSAKYTETERNNLTDEIDAMINNKNSYAIKRCDEEMFKEDIAGISEYGDRQKVISATPSEIYSSYVSMLREAKTEVFYIGGTSTEVITEEIIKMYEGFERRYSVVKKSAYVTKAEKVKNVTEKMKTTQGKLSMGFRLGTFFGDDDYYALPVFGELYGGSPVSKLFMNVREKLSLCYYCRSIPDATKGTMIVASGIEVKNKEKTQNEILYQLEKVKNGEITDEELESAKKSLYNGYREITDSHAAIESWYMTRILAGIDSSIEETSSHFEKVTKEQVVNIARKITLDTVYFLEGTLSGDGEDEENE